MTIQTQQYRGAVDTDTGLPRINTNDRIAIFGQTGTGKSIYAHYLFRTITVRLPTEKRPQGQWRLIVDVMDSVYDDALTFFDPSDIPWAESPSLRYVPNIDTIEKDINTLYQNIVAHGYCWVWLDEANEVSSAHRTVAGLRKVLLQGRKLQIGHASVTPRPVDISKSVITQSQHIFTFPLTDSDDRNRLAKNFGMEVDEYENLMASLPDYGYLWYVVNKREMYVMPPLPPEIVQELE